MKLIDALHAAGIHVILDWVPGLFCKDAHGLYMLDGTNTYEAAEHPQWGTMEFDYGKPEVVTFLLSNAYFWMDQYHADGLRIDGVASMLYLNYGYDDEWRKNEFGGNDDLKAVRTALDFEARGEKFYAQLRDASSDPKEKSFFDLLSKMERQHYLSLKDTEDYFSDPEGWFRKKEHHGIDGA